MTRKLLVRFFIVLFSFLPAISCLYASSLTVETDYRVRGVSFSNNDFDVSSSTDARSYYSQRIGVTIGGSFAPGVRIATKLTAIGVAGSTSTLFATPYPNTTLTPYIENAYVVLTNFNDLPVDIIAGKQPLSYGDGLIIDDNGVGFNAFRIIGHTSWPIKWDMELVTAKLTDNFRPDADADLYGGVAFTDWKQHHWELGYFRYINDAGYVYTLPGNITDITKEVYKQFYDIRVGRRNELSLYQFELAKQTGYITRSNNTAIALDGMGYTLRGELYGKNTKLGSVTARAFLAMNTGNDLQNTGTDNSFSPDLTRRFDGLERAGNGQLFAATPTGGYYTLPSAEYSGINTLSLGAEFSPLYGWAFSVDYFLYSTSVGPRGAPVASGFERLFGGEFSIGVEMDLAVKYTHSKYVTSSLSYNRYTPPKFDQLWPHSDPATRYQYEITAKF